MEIVGSMQLLLFLAKTLVYFSLSFLVFRSSSSSRRQAIKIKSERFIGDGVKHDLRTVYASQN